jgi:dienelactone hydrolase
MGTDRYAAQLSDFELDHFTAQGTLRPVYRKGEGPGIVVMSEIPGITPRVADFSRRLVDDGFTVAMPDLFGKAGRAPNPAYALSSMASTCISREFKLFSTRGASAVTNWCRSLARDLHRRCGGAGVGAVGMCLTGNFALAMMLDPSLIAPVLSQPSLPVGPLKKQKRGLHIAPHELRQIRDRSAAENIPVMALRFTGDRLCPRERFEALRENFGSRLRAVEIDSRPGNPAKIPPWAHSVLTEHLVDQEGHPTRIALERVLAFFHERLDVETPA